MRRKKTQKSLCTLLFPSLILHNRADGAVPFFAIIFWTNWICSGPLPVEKLEKRLPLYEFKYHSLMPETENKWQFIISSVKSTWFSPKKYLSRSSYSTFCSPKAIDYYSVSSEVFDAASVGPRSTYFCQMLGMNTRTNLMPAMIFILLTENGSAFSHALPVHV